MKHRQAAFGLTAGILMVVFVVSQATAGPAIALAGPEQVTDDERVTFNATVNATEGVTVDNYTLRFVSTETNESVNVSVAANCTILDFDPESGIVGNHAINVTDLNQTLKVTCGDDGAVAKAGYGYNAEAALIQEGPDLRIAFNTTAFEPTGTYALRVLANTTDGQQINSTQEEFTVVRANES